MRRGASEEERRDLFINMAVRGLTSNPNVDLVPGDRISDVVAQLAVEIADRIVLATAPMDLVRP